MSTNVDNPEPAPPGGGAGAPDTPPPLPPGYVVTAPSVPLPKSPFVAVLLSVVFPGLGQIYNGQLNKAFAFFGAFVASLFAAINIDPMPFALFIPFIVLYGWVDAWKSATAINNRFLGGKSEAEEQEDFNSPVWGGILVAAGLLLLLHNLDILDLERFRRYWPVLLIVAGAYFIRRSLEVRKSSGGPGSGDGVSA
jgi:TM2 domain-containing membrane protein YozV